MPPKKFEPKNYKTEEGFKNGVGSGVQVHHVVPKKMLEQTPERPHLCFRGDSRSTAEVFEKGFGPRENLGIVYRTTQQDIDPASAVCVSTSIDVAALFPFSDINATPAMIQAGNMHAPQQTTVYIVCPKEIFNTEKLQRAFANREIIDQGVAEQKAARLNLFAKERAAESIAAEEVIAAVQVVRQWAGPTFEDGGIYTIIGCTINPRRAARFEKAGHSITALFLNRKLENALGGTCKLPVAREIWERVLDAKEGEFRQDVWEEAFCSQDGNFADPPQN